MINIFEVRLKEWRNKDFTSGEIYITTLDEINTLTHWLEQLKNTPYDEISIRVLNHEDTQNVVKQVKEQQSIETIYEMFGDDLTPYPDIVQYFENNDEDNDNSYEVITLNISETLWQLLLKEGEK
jgi:hypothetical protein